MTLTAERPQPSRSVPDPTRVPRLLLAPGEDEGLAAHRHRHGPLPRPRPEDLLDALDDAGLTGRGGAGFPAGRKWRAVADARGRAVVVGNGSEGEPASRKDRLLLGTNPHLVLDGLQLAAHALRASKVVLALSPGAWRDGEVHRALHERRHDPRPVELVGVPDRFLSGEESALVDVVEGGTGLPRTKWPLVVRRGVDGRPTLVQNVESLAHVALVARYGAGWFRALGSRSEPGTMLVTVQQPDGSVAVSEAAHGTPLEWLVDLDASSALLVGGYHGTWVPAARAAALLLSRDSLGEVGASPGAGVVAALPAGACGLVETARVMTYLAGQSAGQCGPCLNGLPRLAVAAELLAEGRAQAGHVSALQRWSGLVAGRGACRHPDGSVRFLRSALEVFADEVQLHLRGRCSATSRRAVLPVIGGAR